MSWGRERHRQRDRDEKGRERDRWDRSVTKSNLEANSRVARIFFIFFFTSFTINPFLKFMNYLEQLNNYFTTEKKLKKNLILSVFLSGELGTLGYKHLGCVSENYIRN